MVAPHPDDEVIGAGGQLPSMRDPWIVYVTDGAPRNMHDASACGFARPEDYAQARREESLAALALVGISSERALTLGFGDQETALHLTELILKLHAVCESLEPEIILLPPYEGGHPDHDSVAFATHTAMQILEASGKRTASLFEYALYHRRDGNMETGVFLEDSDRPVETLVLSSSAADLKRRMMACFVTQQDMLAHFSHDVERFRRAPSYDFGSPPHPGQLFYEQFQWGVTGEEWRRRARKAAGDVLSQTAESARE